MNNPKKSIISLEEGIVLIEALIAILLFSVGILGAVGLQASMIKANADARYRAEAGLIVEQRISEMWVNQISLSDYAETTPVDISATSGLPNGTRTTVRGDASCNGSLDCFVVTVRWTQPGTEETHNVSSVARITGGI